ncbi:UNVERIFIED_ORG: hypothetical protein ABIC62_004471 [Burkholderia sp. 1595]|uniref:Uncharacterized protein n=1 Tax=Paraburkholderia terricola TaxID=169427 RepID=A0ABU1LWN1_9BURK|nr:hypothetical protein [Paraburkholderia terricola]MDR6483338.1 hypothetical protein [Paraburkholderia terricola]
MVYLFAVNDRRFDRGGQVLPNSLTFEFKVRGQVALFSPRRLPNLLTFELPFEPEHPSLSITDWLALSDVANFVRNNDRAMRPIAAATAWATCAWATAAATRRRSPPASTQGCAQHGQGRNCQQLLHALLLRYIHSDANRRPTGGGTRTRNVSIRERSCFTAPLQPRCEKRSLQQPAGASVGVQQSARGMGAPFGAVRRAHALFAYGRGCKGINAIGVTPGRARVSFRTRCESPSTAARRTPWKSSP